MSTAYKLKEGYSWNPLLKIPRNAHCPCGSGKKWKKCHLNKMPRAMETHLIPDKVTKK